MRTMGEDWKAYQAQDPDTWRYEFRLLVNDEIVESSELYSVSKLAALNADDFELGNCISARLDVEIFDEVIPDIPVQIEEEEPELPRAAAEQEFSYQLKATGTPPIFWEIKTFPAQIETEEPELPRANVGEEFRYQLRASGTPPIYWEVI